MKFTKLSISNEKFDINLKFYYWMKHLVKTKLTDRQACDLLSKLLMNNKIPAAINTLDDYAKAIKVKSPKSENFYSLIESINDQTDVDVFIFSLKLYMIKDLLLAEAKMKELIHADAMSTMDPLSLAYDAKSLYSPYATRVNGALLSLLFFENLENGATNFMSADAQQYIERLSKQAIAMKSLGIEPNQIFMLMFSESVNQSIISDSGSNYEDRIESVLIEIGIPKDSITQVHDEDDNSTELDLYFKLEGRTYGIGAKRTLRERYKQFIKTAFGGNTEVMIEITLGLDLNEEKAKTIIGHGTHIFVSNEIYDARDFLQSLKGVYPVRDLSLETLKSLKNS